MKPILRKTENITLVRQGAYGCHWPVWSSVEAWQAAGSPGPVVIRYAAGGAGSGPCLYGIQPADVPQEIDKLKEQGWRQDRIYLNLEMPLEGLLLQGEYYNTAPPDDVLLFSRARLHMRPALLQGSTTGGLQARLLLRSAMAPSSYEDFTLLCSWYPDHVIEFTCWENCLFGPNRNTMIWEIRKY